MLSELRLLNPTTNAKRLRLLQQNTARVPLKAQISRSDHVDGFNRDRWSLQPILFFFILGRLTDRRSLPQHRNGLLLRRGALLYPTDRIQALAVGLQQSVLSLLAIFDQLLEFFQLDLHQDRIQVFLVLRVG